MILLNERIFLGCGRLRIVACLGDSIEVCSFCPRRCKRLKRERYTGMVFKRRQRRLRFEHNVRERMIDSRKRYVICYRGGRPHAGDSFEISLSQALQFAPRRPFGVV